MRWSRFFLPTLREDPKDADAISVKLMMRAGLIRRLGSGTYSYLPLGLRSLHKAISIVREEMNKSGAQELLMPSLQPTELWKLTGRYELLGDVLIKFKDRSGKEVALGPTHEEVVTDLLKEISSYKQLPVIVYQIQTKFRDEPRARFGIIRSKEFIMKDAYSVDIDDKGLDKNYKTMYEAYKRIFARCGLNIVACEADPGIMGGDISHEFMAPAQSGEDQVVRCISCDYSANLEAASCLKDDDVGSQKDKEAKKVEAVKTPGRHTVEAVSRFLKVSPSSLIKTLIYDVGKEQAAVLVRGDHEVNEAKLARALNSSQLKLSSAETITRVTKAPIGFAGPVKLKGVKLIADHSVMQLKSAVTGANLSETHLINVVPGRDFTPDSVEDLRVITQKDTCPRCKGKIEFITAIEIGHIFKLGTKYSKTLNAVFQTEKGKKEPVIMGCYGIGINRILAAAIEQRHDAQGIIWPVSLAPFQVVVTVMESRLEVLSAGKKIYDLVKSANLETLLDDREQSPGSKLKDADLIGIPVQVIIGKIWQKEKQLEVRLRGSRDSYRVSEKDLIATIKKLLDSASSI